VGLVGKVKPSLRRFKNPFLEALDLMVLRMMKNGFFAGIGKDFLATACRAVRNR
jgi:hypothetical protein